MYVPMYHMLSTRKTYVGSATHTLSFGWPVDWSHDGFHQNLKIKNSGLIGGCTCSA